MESTAWAQEHFQTSPAINAVCSAIQKMQVKALLCKEETLCENDPKRSLALVDQSPFKMLGDQINLDLKFFLANMDTAPS